MDFSILSWLSLHSCHLEAMLYKMKKIAVIEDDHLFNRALSITLEKEGYCVLNGYTYRDAQKLIKEKPDLMIVDINLPDGEGFSVCKEAESYGEIPVIFLTARDEEEDMLKAYDAGCDDYVVKPFPMSVLKKRILAVLRRNDADKDCFHYRELKIEYEKRNVYLKEQKVHLTGKEYRILELLTKNKGKVLSKEQILERVWDLDGQFVGENTVSVTMNRLRKKIEIENIVFIHTVFGVGYRFGD